MKRVLFPIFLLWISIFSPVTPIAQVQDSTTTKSFGNRSVSDKELYIDTILVIGNRTTKDYIILREMSLKVGDKLTDEALEYDKNRIYSLGLFARVEMFYQALENKGTLFVMVDERWYIFPFPVVGIKDHDWKKFYYGLGIVHTNFRGRNEKISFSFALGYDPFVSLRYINPLIGENFFLESKIFYSHVQNKSLLAQGTGNNFAEIHRGTDWTIGKRLTIFQSVWASIGYQFLSVSDYQVGRTLSPDGRDEVFSLGLGYSYDTRDLREYSRQGTFASAAFVQNGIGKTLVNYHRYSADLREYFLTPLDVTLAGRIFTSIAGGGLIPNYSHVYFGYEERIRGHFRTVYEGESIAGGSVELRIPVIKPVFFILPQVSIPEFAVWRFAMYAALFADAGEVWYRDQAFALKNFQTGYGFGFHFLLPYSIVLRTEYAFDQHRKGQFIVDIGASF